MYDHQNIGLHPPFNTSASSCSNTNIMPAQVSPTQHIVKKNTIVHVIPHFHPPSTCNTSQIPVQNNPAEHMWVNQNYCHPPRKMPLLFRRGRF